MFTVDGVAWEIPCDITRAAELTASEISGMLLDRSYFNDVIGTFMQYEVTLVPNPRELGAYYALYELLTQPVAAHDFTLPYNGEELQITGRVEQISDVYVRTPIGPMWKGVSFTVTANHPTKAESLAQAIARGLPALPDVSTPAIGDTYVYTADGWVATATLGDANATEY